MKLFSFLVDLQEKLSFCIEALPTSRVIYYVAVIRGKETKHWGLRTREFFVTFQYILRIYETKILTKPRMRKQKLYIGGVGETASFWVFMSDIER